MLDTLRRQKLLSFTLLLFTLCVGIVIGTLVNTHVSAARGQSAAPDATPLTIPSPVQLGNEFTKLAQKLGPSVVNITADAQPKTQGTSLRPNPHADQQEDEDAAPDDNSDMLKKFFDRFGNRGINPRMFRREQSGSGFIVDKSRLPTPTACRWAIGVLRLDRRSVSKLPSQRASSARRAATSRARRRSSDLFRPTLQSTPEIAAARF